MNRGSTLFLKFAISLIAILALAICIFVLPDMAARDAAAHPDLAYQRYPFLAYAYALCIAFFVALYQAFKLLTYIDANKAFSESAVRALRVIKYCAIIISALIVAGVITVMVMSAGKGEDITGIVMMGLILTFISGIGATLAAVLQKNLQKAVELKSENELTV
ncbi:MAG: DUF2975 domain-containing protein [Williamsia sp.]|nr:DUF2975 domain-containing protein [Williamsia sp.]